MKKTDDYNTIHDTFTPLSACERNFILNSILAEDKIDLLSMWANDDCDINDISNTNFEAKNILEKKNREYK